MEDFGSDAGLARARGKAFGTYQGASIPLIPVVLHELLMPGVVNDLLIPEVTLGLSWSLPLSVLVIVGAIIAG